MTNAAEATLKIVVTVELFSNIVYYPAVEPSAGTKFSELLCRLAGLATADIVAEPCLTTLIVEMLSAAAGTARGRHQKDSATHVKSLTTTTAPSQPPQLHPVMSYISVIYTT